eukprot:COSAG02_NODE_5052_length_4692_cov_2.956238_1_plen_137_part_00
MDTKPSWPGRMVRRWLGLAALALRVEGQCVDDVGWRFNGLDCGGFMSEVSAMRLPRPVSLLVSVCASVSVFSICLVCPSARPSICQVTSPPPPQTPIWRSVPLVLVLLCLAAPELSVGADGTGAGAVGAGPWGERL